MTNLANRPRWYWVKIKGEWFPAMKDPRAVGGWSNQDTWEDFGAEVEEAVEIPYPDEVRKEAGLDRPAE